MEITQLKASLEKHERKRNSMYKDSLDVNTVGYGHNMDDVPLSDNVIEAILYDDIYIANQETMNIIPAYNQHTIARQNVLVEMVFNLGANRFKSFRKMIHALALRDYDEAAKEMLDSLWAKQVGQRAQTLSELMKKGSY